MEQINLRDLISLIIRRKWIILGFTLCCILVSGLVSSFVVKPLYSSRIIFNITPLEFKTGLDNNDTIIVKDNSAGQDTYNSSANMVIGSILNKLAYPKYDTNAITNIMNGSEFKDKMFSEYKLDKSISLRVSCNSDTNQITVIAESRTSKDLVKAIKATSEYVPKYISQEAIKTISKSSAFIKEGLIKEGENLKKYKKEIDQFKSNVQGKPDNLPDELIVKYRELQNNYELSAQAYDSYKLAEKEMDIFDTDSIQSKLNLIVSYEDSLPAKIMPRTGVNLGLGAASGLMFIMFFLIVYEFWFKKK
ncbi:MAG: Wzz/FepE/Etk N-terminal domain-containing protein [Bacillota bacterium]|nr:Wzz/FepE/Etk N-terminal domain-containing protein [Bacillota bacterium]